MPYVISYFSSASKTWLTQVEVASKNKMLPFAKTNKWEILELLDELQIPLIFLSTCDCCNKAEKPFAHKKIEKRDIGFPCLIPLRGVKLLDGLPFTKMHRKLIEYTS